MIFEPIILILTGIGALIIQMIYFIKDDRTANNDTEDGKIKFYWHAAGGVLHIWMGYTVGRITDDWHWGFLMGSLMWYLFDGCVNSFVLGREWWYIGFTAAIDRVQRFAAGLLHIEPRLFSACLKHAVLITSILFLITKYL